MKEDNTRTINTYFQLCLLFLLLLTLFSIIPAIFMSDINQYFESKHDHLYTVLLQVILFVCSPLICNQILDFSESWKEEQERHIWLSKSILAVGLVIPTSLELIFIGSDVYKYLKLSFLLTQKGFILFGISGTMFKTPVSEPRSLLCFENLTIALLASLLLLQFFTSVYIVSGDNNIFIASAIFLLLVFLLLIGILARQIYNKRPIDFSFQFRNDLDYRDFCNTTVLLAFFIANFVGIGTQLESLEDVLRTEQTYDYLQAIIVFVIVLTIVTGRVAVFRARRGKQQLKSRLDMLRYCSHEMRTPLNTAFLGLEFQSKFLQDFINQLYKENDGDQQTIITTTTSTNLKKYEKSILKNSNASLYEALFQFHSLNPNQSEKWNSDIPIFEGKVKSPKVKSKMEKKCRVQGVEENDQNETELAVIFGDLLENTEEVKGSCNVVLQSLNELLMFDKLDEDKVFLDCTMVDPWEFTNSAALPLATNAKHANIHFKILCKDIEFKWYQDFTAKIDSYRLSQVVRNFISNSLKFTTELGNVTVQLLLKKQKTCNAGDIETSNKTSSEENESEGVKSPYIMRLEVIDSGAGISKENQKKLFGQYVQFNANVLQEGNGSGLGLWISKRIIELHEGEIGAFSPGEGLGSTFFFELPLYYKNQNITIHELTQSEKINKIEKEKFYLKLENELLKELKMKKMMKNVEKQNFTFCGLLKSNCKNNRIGIVGTESVSTENHKIEFSQPVIGDIEQGFSIQGSFCERKDIHSEILEKNEKILFSSNLSNNMENSNDDGLNNSTKQENSETESSKLCKSQRKKSKNLISSINLSRKLPFSPAGSDSAFSQNSENEGKYYYRQESISKRWELGLNVLVVDDSSLNRKMMKQLLNSGGQYVEEAKNGDEAVNLLKNRFENQQWMYDVILMDSNMPIMSGPEATREIRKLNFTGLIFGVTGDTDEEQKDFFLQCGVNRVLQKPISLDTIKNAIKTWNNE